MADPGTEGVEVDGLLAGEEGDGLMTEEPARTSLYGDPSKIYKWLQESYAHTRLPRRYRLATEANVLRNSTLSVRFTVMCSAINTKMLNPNVRDEGSCGSDVAFFISNYSSPPFSLSIVSSHGHPRSSSRQFPRYGTL